jgi:pimeloyl-ACP methyl ester carboxylesterase
MISLKSIFCALALLPADLDTKFVQVHPAPDEPSEIERSPNRRRAVVLIHGLRLHPFSGDNVRAARLHDWQRPDHELVELLGKDSDVFAFAYGQNVPVCDVAGCASLRDNIGRLRAAGYLQIVLIGHSAGGLIARQLVEDCPGGGVTKVIQVCAPNGGSDWSRLTLAVHKDQEPFLQSLTRAACREFRGARSGTTIPLGVEFVCVVADGGEIGDFVVSDESQWPAELQDQGIPALRVRATHFGAMRNRKVAERLAELVRDDQPRCDADRIATLRKEILGE